MEAVLAGNSRRGAGRSRRTILVSIIAFAAWAVAARPAAGLSPDFLEYMRAVQKAALAAGAPSGEAAGEPAVATAEAAEAAADLPTGAEVLDRFIEVTGGAEAYAGVHTRVLAGTLEFVGMGIQSKVKAWQVEPNRFYTLRMTEGLGPVEEGCDGEVVWAASLTQGPEVARDLTRAYKLRAYRLNADYHWRELYARVECAGVEDVAGERCYKVVKYPAEGHPETAWYAVASGLLVSTDVIVPTPMGDIPTRTFYSDYRASGGVRVPFSEVIRTMGREQRMVYDAIACNAEIPEDRFDLPRDIQTLVERYRAKAEADSPPTE